MKKQLLLLLSSMLLLTACGEDNSASSGLSTPTTSETSTTSGSSQTPVEPTKIDVTIKITAKGIEEYTGTHSKIYINSNFDSADWSTYVMSQDTEDKNIWTYTFSEVEVDARYKFNTYYGGESTPDWANGCNAEVDSENYRVVSISKDKSVYEFESTFTIPTKAYSFTLKLTPHIQSTEGTDDKMYDSTYLWMWHSPDNNDVLEKQSDGTWTFKVEDYTGGAYEFTPCLGYESEMKWGYQHGAYEDGKWVKWNSIKITLEESKTSYDYQIYFNGQPDEITGTTYSVTWNYAPTSWDNIGSSMSVRYKVNAAADYSWLTMNWIKADNKFTYTLANISSGTVLTYNLYSWKATGDERTLVADDTGADFSITVTKDLEYILTGDFPDAAGFAVAKATPVE